jgi:hypothetical protein
MYAKHPKPEQGSVLMMVLITISILTFICATSLYVLSQNAHATTQTTSWQQSMSGAEAAVDMAMKALNANEWGGWYPVAAAALPSGRPSPSATPFPSGYSTKPGANQYYYYSSSFPLQGEASNGVTMWVTVDDGSIAPTSSNFSYNGQSYRIRGAAAVGAPGPVLVSNNRLDNDLRKISLRWDRLSSSGSGAVANSQAVRRIEAVAQPVLSNDNWPRGITLQNWISMSGSSTVYCDIGTANSRNSDLRNMYVYGDVQYSGPAIRNTSHVQGTISTPFNVSFITPANPDTNNWATADTLQQYSEAERRNLPVYTNGNYTPYTGGGGLPRDAQGHPVTSFTASGSSGSPTLIKVNGDFTVSGGGNFNILSSGGGAPKYLVIWVAGKFTLSGGSSLTQNSGAMVTWIVDRDFTISGGSYNNQGSSAENFETIGVGANNVTISSSSAFMGTINAPGSDATISGSGNYTGAVIANTLTLSGSGRFSFDGTLRGNNGPANYSYASWFEDNSDPARGIIY